MDTVELIKLFALPVVSFALIASLYATDQSYKIIKTVFLLLIFSVFCVYLHSKGWIEYLPWMIVAGIIAFAVSFLVLKYGYGSLSRHLKGLSGKMNPLNEEQLKVIMVTRDSEDVDELLKFCFNDEVLSKILMEEGIGKSDLSGIYDDLLKYGLGINVGENYLAASALIYEETLRYVLEHYKSGELSLLYIPINAHFSMYDIYGKGQATGFSVK